MFINVICYYVRCKGNEVFRMEEQITLIVEVGIVKFKAFMIFTR